MSGQNCICRPYHLCGDRSVAWSLGGQSFEACELVLPLLIVTNASYVKDYETTMLEYILRSES